MNQYILFLLKPLRIWCFVPSTRGALTYLSIQCQQTHPPTATGMSYVLTCECMARVGGGKTQHLSIDPRWIQTRPGCPKGFWE